MQYVYCFANTSLVLRLMTYLSQRLPFELASVTVIYLIDRWVVRIKLRDNLSAPLEKNFLAFLKENGYAFTLSASSKNALSALDRGASVEDVVRLHHLVIVSHGGLYPNDVEAFRETFVSGLGYCPPSLV